MIDETETEVGEGSLDEVFDVPESDVEVVKVTNNAMVPVKGDIVTKEEIRANYEDSRTTLKANIDVLEDAMRDALSEIKRDPSPRAIEVLGNLAKVITQSANALSTIHTGSQGKEKKTLNVKGDVNNNTIAMTGKDMQKFLDGDLDE